MSDWAVTIDAAARPGLDAEAVERLTVAAGGNIRYDAGTGRLRAVSRPDGPAAGPLDAAAAALAVLKAAAAGVGIDLAEDGIHVIPWKEFAAAARGAAAPGTPARDAMARSWAGHGYPAASV